MHRIPAPPMAGLFAQRMAGRLELARLSKATLTDLSHVLENMVLEFGLPATVLTGFQTTRNWAAELERYQRLVEPLARQVAVFAAGNLGDTGRIVAFDLGADSPLVQEWFLFVLTDEFCVGLFGDDNPSEVPPSAEMDRVFDAAWTFEPTLVQHLLDTLVQQVHHDQPDRVAEVLEAISAHPPRPANPVYEQRFHARVFSTLEAGRQRWRRELVRSHAVRERLVKANEELLRMERLAMLGTTAATLAHELNNPLASIMMTGELMEMRLEKGDLDLPSVAASARSIQEMANRAGRMTRGILDLVRLTEASIEPVVLKPWLVRFGEEMQVASERRITVIAPDDAVASADADRLRHIVTNLVNNAIQASPAGSAVHITASTTATTVELRVSDHGSGVPEHLRSVLFEPFRTSKAATGGTGLGLALARRFAEDQRGRLTLESTGPDGTVFLLSLPSARAGDTSAEAQEPAADTQDGGRRILVIDDDPNVRGVLARLLEQSGWSVSTAADEHEATAAVAAHHHDALLIDYRLSGGGTGVELLSLLDEVRPGTRARALMITGSLSQEVPADAPPILLKPFSRGELDAALRARVTSADATKG